MVLTNSTSVGRKWHSSRCTSIAHDQDIAQFIVTRTERVLENTARFQNNLRVVSRSLTGRTSIKVPLGKGFQRRSLGGRESACLGTTVTICIYPDVFREDLVTGVRKSAVAINHAGVKLRTTGRGLEHRHLKSATGRRSRATSKRSRWDKGRHSGGRHQSI